MVLNPMTMASDGTSSFTNGYAGLYLAGGSGAFLYDHFSLDVIPEPATLGVLAVSAAGLLLARRLRI